MSETEQITAKTSVEETQVGSAETDKVKETAQVEKEVSTVEFEEDEENSEKSMTTEEGSVTSKSDFENKYRRDDTATQKGGKDSEQARLRREREKKEQYRKGIIDALGGVNPYTGQAIEDDEDIEVFRTMQEIARKGGDPQQDYFSYRKEQRQEAERKVAEAQRDADRKDWFAKDKKLFQDKYPDIDIAKLAADKQFTIFANGKVGNVPLAQIYEDWMNLNETYQQQAQKKVQREMAKAKASPGSLAGSGDAPQKSYGDMTDEEMESMIAKAKRGELKKS